MRGVVLYVFFPIFILFFSIQDGFTAILNNSELKVELTNQIQLLYSVKPDRFLKPEQVINDTASFKPLNPLVLTKFRPLQDNVFWIRIKLTDVKITSNDCYVYLPRTWDRIDLYSKSSNGLLHLVSGSLVPISQRSYQAPVTAFKLSANQARSNLFIRLSHYGNYSPPSFTATLSAEPLQLSAMSKQSYWQGFFLGVIFLLAVYALMVYLSTRNSSYLYFVGVLVSFGFIYMSNYNFEFWFFWPEHPIIDRFMDDYPCYDIVCGTFLLKFGQSFLQTKRNLPLFHKILNGFIVAHFIFLACCYLQWIPTSTGWLVSSILGIFYTLFQLFAGITLAIRGFKPAKLFVLGTSFMTLGTCIFLIQDVLHIFPIKMYTYPMQIGNLIDAVILSFALSVNIRYIQEENKRQKDQLEKEKEEKILIREKAVKEAKEEERRRLSQDIHDDIGSGLSHISIVSSRLTQGMLSSAQQQELALTLNQLTTSLGENMRDLIWFLGEQQINLKEMLYLLRELVSEYLESYPATLVIRTEKEEEVPPLVLRKEAYREINKVVKEALNNLVKHSNATTIQFNMEVLVDELRLSLQDNGIGMNLNELKRKSGIQNMHGRIQKLGGQLLIHSETGNGTNLEIFLPLHLILGNRDTTL